MPMGLDWDSACRGTIAGTQLIGRHQDRGQGGARLGLEEAKALGQLAGNQVAQADIIDQSNELDVLFRLLC